jgi:hypothetical protein
LTWQAAGFAKCAGKESFAHTYTVRCERDVVVIGCITVAGEVAVL